MSTTTDYATIPTSMLRAIATSLYTPEYRKTKVLFTDPPPGVKPHIGSRPNGLGICYITIAVVLLVISTIVVALRFYARKISRRSLSWDDYTCAASLGFTYIWTGATFNSALLGLGNQAWNVQLTIAEKEEYGKMNWLSASAYIFAVALIKVSLLILYLHTFRAKGFFRITLWTVMIAIIISHGQVIILYWAKVEPFVCIWKYVTLPGELWSALCRPRFNQLDNWIFVSIFTVILDVIVLVLSIRAVWKLHMAKRQKIVVSMLIGVGAIVTIIGLIRFIWIYNWFVLPHSASYSNNNTFLDFRVDLCSDLELNLAIVCTSLPSLKGLVQHFGIHIFGTTHSSTFASSSSKNRNKAVHSATLHPSRASRKRPGQPDEENVIDGSYLELVDGKTNQNYNMTTKLVESNSSFAGNSH